MIKKPENGFPFSGLCFYSCLLYTSTEYEIRKAVKLAQLIPPLAEIVENEPKKLNLRESFTRTSCHIKDPVIVFAHP